MTAPALLLPRCTAAWCPAVARPGQSRCVDHTDDPDTWPLRNDYELSCHLCQHGCFASMTDDELRNEKHKRCRQPFCIGTIFVLPLPTKPIEFKPLPPIPNATDIQLRPPRGGRAYWPAA